MAIGQQEEIVETQGTGAIQSKGLSDRVGLYAVDAVRQLDPGRRAKMGQFFTPPIVARFMASLFGPLPEQVRLLDAGAGVGCLTAAFVGETCQRETQPKQIEVTDFEQDPFLAEYLNSVLAECRQVCSECGIEFVQELPVVDFVEAGIEMCCRRILSFTRSKRGRKEGLRSLQIVTPLTRI